MKIWICRSSPQSGSRNAWVQIKNVNSATCLSKFWNFFGAIQMISCHDWWPWMKPHYTTMTRRQNNIQWSGSIVANPTPKNSECKILLEKFSPWFFRIKMASSSIIFQRAKLSTWSITHLCWCNWSTFWRKNTGRENVTKGVFFLPDNARLTGHLLPRQNWPAWASNVLITHPILRNWPRLAITCSLELKNNWKVARALLVGRTNFRIFLSDLQKLEQPAKKCIELRGEYVRCSLFPSWSG